MNQTDTVQTTQQPDSTLQQLSDTSSVAATPPTVAPKVQYVQHYNHEIPATLLAPAETLHDTQPQRSDDYLLICNDSLFAPYAHDTLRTRESLFVGNGHSRNDNRANQHIADNTNGWFFGLLVLLLALMSIHLNTQRFKFKDIFQSIFDRRVLERVFRENNIRRQTLFPMTCIYMASLSMTVLYFIHKSEYIILESRVPLYFLLILAGLVLSLLVKNGLIQLFGILFESRSSTQLYISSNYLFYMIGGLVCTPLLLLLYYGTDPGGFVPKLLIGIICILFFVRILRGMQLILTNSKSAKLYLFYYLCIFEIIPLLVISKVLFL